MNDKLQYIALLSKLEVSPEELKSVDADIQNLLSGVDSLPNYNIDFDNGIEINLLRIDSSHESLSSEQILKGAKFIENNFFVVKKKSSL